MNYSTLKVEPFEQMNQGESLDEKFFQRMRRFEDYYQDLSKDDSQFSSNYQILKRINELINEEQMSQNDVWNIIQYFNENYNDNYHEDSGWLDTRLHLRHLAFVYGIRMKLNNEFKLIRE